MEFRTPELCDIFFFRKTFAFPLRWRRHDLQHGFIFHENKKSLQQMRSAHFSNDFVIEENIMSWIY